MRPKRVRCRNSAEPDRDGEARDDHQHVVGRNADAAERDLAVGHRQVAELLRVGAPEEAQHVLEHQDQREREQQLEALVAVVDRCAAAAR